MLKLGFSVICVVITGMKHEWELNSYITNDVWGCAIITSLTLKAPRKTASENVDCLCRLLNILANFSKLFFAYRQTVLTQIRLLLKEQSDLGPHCL